MADQQFCLRWNNHQSTLISVLDSLLENGTLVDCTLAAEGQYLPVHKVVLSACSPYLETLLSRHYEKHPIVILKDVKYTELRAMVDYMYRGEVNISQDQLGTFLKAAESLQIKGLSDNGADGDGRDVGSTPKGPPAKAQPTPTNRPEPPRPASPPSSAHRTRDGSISPSSRKRRRIRRNSQGDDANMGDSHLDSNSCDLPNQAQSTPLVPNIPATVTSISATPIKATIVKPEQTDLVNRIDSSNLNSLPPESGLLKEKIEPISEPLLEPKTEYLEDTNNDDSVEDLTLDDDDEMDEMDMSNMSNMSNISRPGPSHGNDVNQLANQGFVPWQLGGNQTGTDEVFMAAQEAVQAHRGGDSQGDGNKDLQLHDGQLYIENESVKQIQNQTTLHIVKNESHQTSFQDQTNQTDSEKKTDQLHIANEAVVQNQTTLPTVKNESHQTSFQDQTSQTDSENKTDQLDIANEAVVQNQTTIPTVKNESHRTSSQDQTSQTDNENETDELDIANEGVIKNQTTLHTVKNESHQSSFQDQTSQTDNENESDQLDIANEAVVQNQINLPNVNNNTHQSSLQDQCSRTDNDNETNKLDLLQMKNEINQPGYTNITGKPGSPNDLKQLTFPNETSQLDLANETCQTEQTENSTEKSTLQVSEGCLNNPRSGLNATNQVHSFLKSLNLMSHYNKFLHKNVSKPDKNGQLSKLKKVDDSTLVMPKNVSYKKSSQSVSSKQNINFDISPILKQPLTSKQNNKKIVDNISSQKRRREKSSFENVSKKCKYSKRSPLSTSTPKATKTSIPSHHKKCPNLDEENSYETKQKELLKEPSRKLSHLSKAIFGSRFASNTKTSSTKELYSEFSDNLKLNKNSNSPGIEEDEITIAASMPDINFQEERSNVADKDLKVNDSSYSDFFPHLSFSDSSEDNDTNDNTLKMPLEENISVDKGNLDKFKKSKKEQSTSTQVKAIPSTSNKARQIKSVVWKNKSKFQINSSDTDGSKEHFKRLGKSTKGNGKSLKVHSSTKSQKKTKLSAVITFPSPNGKKKKQKLIIPLTKASVNESQSTDLCEVRTSSLSSSETRTLQIKDDIASKNVSSSMKPSKDVTSDRLRFFCEFCCKDFSSKHEFMKHNRTFHTPNNLFF